MTTTMLTCVTCLTFVLLTLVLYPVGVTSMVTSIEKLRDLAERGSSTVSETIEAAILLEMEKIRDLNDLLKEHSKKTASDEFNLHHPNDLFKLVKYYVNFWFSQRSSNRLLDEAISKQQIDFPTMADLEVARASLIRLQYVYKLSAREMFDGNYLGYKGLPLDVEDAYMLGRDAFASGFLFEAEQWLVLSTDKLANALGDVSTLRNNSQIMLGRGFSSHLSALIRSFALLGRVYYYKNDTGMARQLYDQCKASEVAEVGDVKVLSQELNVEDQESQIKRYNHHHRATDIDMTVLCSRDKDRRVTFPQPYHVCRYKPDVFIPYQRFKEEILSTSPYASLFYDVILDPEIEHMKGIVKKTLVRGKVLHSSTNQSISKDRTGELAWVADSKDATAAKLSQRVKAFTRLEVTERPGNEPKSAEEFQVVNYGLGGHYDVHLDPMLPGTTQKHLVLSGERIATVLFYMSDVEKGGGTVFPHLGVSVAPKKGMALMWYNFEPDMGPRNQRTLHAGCPVLVGNKWIANKWIWTYGNTFRRPCGPTPDSKQLEVEELVSVNALKEIQN